MATRAVHLEVLNTLSGKCFINCLRRFAARHNATNFKIGQRLIHGLYNLQNIFDGSSVNKFLANESITWRFTTPLSPWKGGFHERMIGTFKSCLKKSLSERPVASEEFQTLITEIEAMVNSGH
ncbi:unnamed protein product [Heligmosomoides polygyrus]|uniref:Transposase n=1 Tax=Heligmosomoides polygyrus TaxID=6339 RepID=A0A183GAD0_HELPZ|nr:unnamed protein product [Heligmosomoides polygyrus]